MTSSLAPLTTMATRGKGPLSQVVEQQEQSLQSLSEGALRPPKNGWKERDTQHTSTSKMPLLWIFDGLAIPSFAAVVLSVELNAAHVRVCAVLRQAYLGGTYVSSLDAMSHGQITI